jgi:Terminase large subunit, T4likevirus-type, N-terminal
MAVLEADLRLALDRLAFWRAAGIGEPLPWQERALASEAPMQLYNCARQSGKSQVAAALAVHKVLYTPDTLVLMVSRTLDHSGELFMRALKLYRNVGRPVAATSETALSLTLENGSRIVARPGASDVSVRGYTADLLLVDEAARVSNDLYVSATPALARTGGRIVALSTPFGSRGWFYEEWRGDEGWDRYRITADDLPHDWYLPSKDEFLARERRRLGEWWFRQEYFAEFLDAQTQAFRREDIEAAFSEELEAWDL